MNKAVRKFVWSAEGAILILLTVLLSVINVMNFAMASDDADQLTQRIADQDGMFRNDRQLRDYRRKDPFHIPGFDNMGPYSPEMDFSLRYFTFAFDKDGNPENITFKMSSLDESEAESWARSLIGGKTGWTRETYRYRVYKANDKTYVTVIDQGRELISPYRILIISVIGWAVLLILSFIILMMVGRRIFRPIEESDRKQKQFIANVENEFRVPLTVINANTELIERKHGPDETTNTINKQVRRMTATVRELSSLSVFEEKDKNISTIHLSDILSSVIDSRSADFEQKNIRLVCEIADDVILEGDGAKMKKAISEIVDNAVKFAGTEAVFRLQQNNKRIILTQENDTALKDGSIDQIFDRFTMLENANGTKGIGLGLSYVKQTALAHSGRVSANVKNGRFILQMSL